MGAPQDSVDFTDESKLFNLRTGKTFLKRIGGISSLDFFPYTLEPTNVFYDSIDSIKRKNNFSGKKFPFKHIKDGLEEKIEYVNIKIHRYPGKLSVLVVSIYPIKFIGTSDELLLLQKLEYHFEIYNLVKTICVLIRYSEI